jgi:LysM repeat protein/3D (Asp-Asp-Asp) domain-containing protein
MKRFIRYGFVLSALFALVEAKSIECRVIVGTTDECNPYSQRFLKAKEIQYAPDRKKLIVEKTLPVPLNPKMRIFSIEDMLDAYVKVEDSLRFKGSEAAGELYETQKLPKAETEQTAEQPVEMFPSFPEENLTQPVEANLSTVMVEGVQEENRTQPSPVKIPPQQSSPVETPPPPKMQVPEERHAQMHAPQPVEYGIYRVKKGDTLSRMTVMFGIRTKELMRLNKLKKKDHLKIGQELQIPLPQKVVDGIASASYTVDFGDYLIGIADMFKLNPSELAFANGIKYASDIYVGRVLDLPLPYKLAEKKKRQKKTNTRRKPRQKTRFVTRSGKNRLRVTATAYTSHRGQTDNTPFLAAWNNRLRPGMKAIAVSRDLLHKYGMRNGTRVKIAGLSGYYRVRDKMNKRYKKRIDIYMGTNRRKALKWGRRSVVIYW